MFDKFIANQAAKIEKVRTRQSNTKMNLIKTYSIIAVVAGHCRGGGIGFPMENWILPYFYDMAIFVFVSGYFYKKEYDDAKFFAFIKSRVMRLVVPYFIWNFVYGLLNTFFRGIGVIDYGDPISLYSLFVRPWVDGHQFHFNIPAWFLLSLFIVSVITYIMRRLMKLLHILNEEVLLAITFIISVISIYFAQNGYNSGVYLCLVRAGFLLPYFQMGFVYKKYESLLGKHKAVLIGVITCCVYALLVLSKGNIDVTAVFAEFIGNPLILTALTILEILLTATICEILAPAFCKSSIVKKIGDNTFSIMMHHGIILFSVNLVIYIMSKFVDISGFDVAAFKSTLWYAYPWRDSRIYLFYVILAVAVPIVIKYISNKVILRANSRKNMSAEEK